MILRKLKGSEHGLTRPLWERVFDDDTQEFLDYYYTNKTDDNEIYVIEKDGEIHSMLHLNPYVMQIREKEEGSRYIVAVATDILYRKQGYMRELLRKSIRDMYVQKIPFAFLMPASDKIYYPHHFRFIYDAEQWEASAPDGRDVSAKELTSRLTGQKVQLRCAVQADCRRIARFAQSILKDQYQVYVKRDWIYYETMLIEQFSQKGGILLAEEGGEIRGAVLYDEMDGFSVREPLIMPGYENIFKDGGLLLHKKEKKKPIIMARLLHVESLMSCMVCTGETDFQFELVDPVIRENNKIFQIRGNQEHLVARTRPLVKGKHENVQKISVSALTTILFGYKPIEKVEEEEQEMFSAEFKEQIGKLVPLDRVFLNEVV